MTISEKDEEPKDFKGSFKGDIVPYKAYIGPYWQYFGLSVHMCH